MKTRNDIKITILPPRIRKDEIYIRPKWQGVACILENLFDKDQLDGYRIFKEGSSGEEIDCNED